MGRSATGVKGITLATDDEVVGLDLLTEGATILTATENGYGKRTAHTEYRVQGRGGQGIITIKTSERNGKVVGFVQTTDEDELMIITLLGMIIRIRTEDIKVIGRNTQGVTLCNLQEGDRVVAIARVED
jgi:DNA gyrase subunit A